MLAALCTLVAAPAFAATISGKISDTGATGLGNMEVRLWKDAGKGYVIDRTLTTAADGTYSFTSVPAGTYKLDARMAPMVAGNFGDRWYDVAPPMADGYVGEDADEITVGDLDVLTGINITLEVLGGLDARVVSGVTPVEGVWVRAESKVDARIHHNDQTDGPCCGTNPHLGRTYFRGMVPGNYRFILYDPAGIYRTTVLPGPYTVTSGNNPNAGDLALTLMVPDPSEPNGSSSAAGTPTIAALPYAPQNASVAPAGDVDYYCFNGVAGERYRATVESKLTIDGVERAHPWFDPMIGLWDGTSITRSNDDAVPGQTRDAVLDSGFLPADGRYCFVVTTFGDSGFTGAGQLSRGEYQLDIRYGNRPPTLSVTYQGAAVPTYPDEIAVDEGQAMAFQLAFADPDGDLLNVEVRHEDGLGMTVTTGHLARQADTATYTWTPDQQAESRSPYELTFRVTDPEYDIRIPVAVRVGAVSVPPTVPTPVEPANGATVTTGDVALVIANSTDPDGDTLTYDYEAEYGEPDGTPEAEATEPESASGMTSTMLTAIPENTTVSWRARAFDGADYSAWSAWSVFTVDAANDPPDAPTIVKPTDGQTLEERQPTIAATVPDDPEGDELTLQIELARDPDFAELVAQSGAIAPGTDPMMVSWLVEELLDWGGEYFVRASATDARGATSMFSEVVAFRVRFEDDLVAPSFSGAYALCEPTTVEALPAEISVLNIDDSGDVVRFEVQIARADAPDVPVSEGAADQSTAIETQVPLTASSEPTAGEHLVRVRAVRGDELSEWTECPLTLAGADGDGTTDENVEGDGCGCGAAGGNASGLFIAALGLALGRVRRRSRK